MDLTTLIIQIILTIPLTIILNYINTKDKNRINQLIIPTIYIIIISALIPSIKENIFLIVVFEIFIRNFYVTSIVNQKNEISNTSFLIESIISIAISLFTYNYFISQVELVIPDPSEIKPFLWFLIIVYFIYMYGTITKDRDTIKKDKNIKLKEEQIITEYAKYKNQFYQNIKAKNSIINNLIYSLMIYKSNKKPKLYRNIKENICRIFRIETEYGIMQIKSLNPISDIDSIIQTLNNMESLIKNNSMKEQDQLNKLLSDYPEESKEEILYIYNTISEFNKR